MKNSKSYIMKNVFFFLMCTGLANLLSGQQMNSYQMYHLNNYLQCPAVAGTKPYVFVSTGYAQNWSGFKGGPNMQSATSHALISERVGVGGKVNYENTGLSSQFGAEVTYAYHAPVGANGTRLSFGLSALMSQYSLKKDAFIVADIDDEAINNAENSIIVPDAAFGISLYRPNKFFLNYGVFQLLNRKVSFLNDGKIENRRVRHHIINMGYQFLVGDKVKLEPSALFKITESGFNQIDIGLKSTIHDIFSLGLFYRTDEALVTFIGIDTKNVVYGYSYGILMNDIKQYSVGTHEIMLILKLNTAKSNL